MTRLRSLRIFVVAMLILLGLQYEFGMAVNLSPGLEDVPPLAGTVAAIWAALASVGGAALIHAILGTFLTVVSLASLALAIGSGVRSVTAIGVLSFISIAAASLNGVLFTLSGFKDDHYSHGMATLFLLAFSLHFVQLCILTVRLHVQAAA